MSVLAHLPISRTVRSNMLFTIRLPAIEGRALDLTGLLDCMRYDLCRIVDWNIEPKSYGKIWVIRLEGAEITLQRWQSFGLFPLNIR